MNTRHADLVEVRGGQDQPTHFLWRDRIYAVREVLGHWIESGAWRGEARAVPVAPAVPAAVDAAEREVWRVEASPGRCFAAGVYDLSFDRAAGRWTLTSTTD
ncbi:hypothetical protein ABIA33_001750 [Streptacidiphilus sp. MAP12-16]|uniref:DUF6504 family protein n=1 Tax=Streptacidiphilus sp. MAP12-16 TaxID=3156300 RepID=UPI0035181627